ncbi:pyridine nucleotide-disulfide oxidoreductase [Gordonibacter sp. An230]|uniref:FAD-dependent oxidoreductase n=1 Tax=Gordonibacter sp. An230 TaxID=1965592 RepID=UPI000B37702A|nr:FAD-dependent oxidoreductase [Gordonibacter sp. An230]OUO90664.1 pyridine nucleotide-disulfide oxidoreductase [Gordonibacter sp. An230]
MEEYFDLIVIGGGPAGLAAGIYGGRARLRTLILEKGNIGGRVYDTREIVNYPSVDESTGPELMERMAEHARKFGAEIRRQTVRSVDFSSDDKLVSVRKATYHAKAVILATGTSPRVLGIPGEKEFAGNGVSYCATCDAEFYQDEDVVVLGSGDQAIEESEFIAKFARSVTIVVVHDEGVLDCNKLAAEQALKNPKLRFLFNSTIAEVYGLDEVEGVKIKDVRTDELSDLPCQGVFFFCGMVPATDFLGDAVPRDSRGWLHTGDDMDLGIGGVFAAGDVRQKYLRQVATAVGDGAAAATAAERYLAEMEQFRTEVLESDEPVLLGFWDPGLPGSMEALGELRAKNREQEEPLRFLEFDVNLKRGIAAKYGVSLNEQNKAQVVRENG